MTDHFMRLRSVSQLYARIRLHLCVETKSEFFLVASDCHGGLAPDHELIAFCRGNAWILHAHVITSVVSQHILQYSLNSDARGHADVTTSVNCNTSSILMEHSRPCWLKRPVSAVY